MPRRSRSLATREGGIGDKPKKVKPPAGVKGPVKPRPKRAPSPEDTRTPRQPRLTRQEKREIEAVVGGAGRDIAKAGRKTARGAERLVGTVEARAAHEARLRAIAAFQKMGLGGSKPYSLKDLIADERSVAHTVADIGEGIGRSAFDLGKKQVTEGGIPRGLKHNLWDDQRGTLGYLSGEWFLQSKNQERVAEATIGKSAANLLYHGERSHPIEATLQIGSVFPIFKWAKVVTDIARGGRRAKQAAEVVDEGRVFYRGTRPGGERASTGIPEWDDNLFLAATEEDAKLYGPNVEKVTFKPEAKILRHGTPEYEKIAVPQSEQAWPQRTLAAARAAGYDAVAFRDQGALGTVVMNEDAVVRGARAERPLPRPSIPPTLDQIDKRLPAMDKEYERLVKRTEERFEMDPDAVRLETRYRNRGRGKRAYGKAKQPTPQKTVNQEKRAAAEAAIYDAAPKVPGLKAFLDERDMLRARRNELAEATFDKPAKVLPVRPGKRGRPLPRPTIKGKHFNQHGELFFDDVLKYDKTRAHNIYDDDGNIIGSMVYDNRPERASIYVESVFIRPEFRNIENLQRLIQPILEDGRPIHAVATNKRLGRMLDKAVASGRIKGKIEHEPPRGGGTEPRQEGELPPLTKRQLRAIPRPRKREPMVTPEVERAALAGETGEPATSLGAQYLEHSPVGQEIAGLPPEGRIREALGSERYRRAVRDKEIREARKERIGSAFSQYEASGGGVEGLQAMSPELAGEIPTRLSFNKLKAGTLTEEELDDMVKVVMAHPALRLYDRVKAARALSKIFHEGQTLQKNEIEKLRVVFGDDAETILEAGRLKKMGELVIDVVNIPRSIMASFDLSAPLRQGFVAAFISPKHFFKAWEPMFKTLTSEPRYQAFLDDLEEHPMFELAERMGVNFTELRGKTALNREEVFSSQMAEKITGLGIQGGRFSPVRASGRAYTAFLDKLRLDLFEELMRAGKAAGYNMEDAKQLRSVATLVNAATGRGGLGKKLESSAPLLNAIFFAPRLIASRIQMFTLPFDPRQSQFVRLEALRAMSRMAGTVTMILALSKWAGADVELDPRSSDFGKMRLGNTRVDLLGGFQQYIRFGSQMATQQTKSPITGKVEDLGAGFDKTSAKELAYRFLESKSAPPVSFLMDLGAQENFKGDPFTWKGAVKERLIPLAISDAIETGTETGDPAKGIGAYIAAGLGLGVQTFHDTRPEERAKKLKDWQKGAEKDWKEKLSQKTPLPLTYVRAARDRDALAARKETLPWADVAEDKRTNGQYAEYQRARFQMVTEYLYQTYPQWKSAKSQLDGLYRQGNPVLLDTWLTGTERKLTAPLTQFNSMLANRKKIERAK